MKSQKSEWKEWDNQFIDLQNNIDLDNFLAPSNRASELERFKESVAEGKPYNPVFTFDPLPEVHEKELNEFDARLPEGDPMAAIFREAARYRLGEIRAAKTHLAEDVTRVSHLMYGSPDDAVLKTAWNNVKTLRIDQSSYNGSKPGRIYDAYELAALCRDAMARYGFNWKVVVKKEMGAKAAVDNLIREFWIRSDVKFHESLVRMMIVHEIGTHVLRSENGYAQPLKIFGRGLPAYQYTEEGLAEYAEERTGTLLTDTLYRISGRVIGVRRAIQGSFWDVYSELSPYFDVDMAFDIAQRAKLGIEDTAQAGAYTKDYTYLAGLLKMRDFFQSAGSADLDALFAGKVGFQHLDTVRQLQNGGYLSKPSVYPEWHSQNA